MKKLALVPIATALLFTACSGETGDSPATTQEAPGLPAVGTDTGSNDAATAQRIARESIIVDGHIDLPYRLLDHPDELGKLETEGDFDYRRATAGGLNAPFMSIYTSTDQADAGASYRVANQLIDIVEQIVAQHPDKFAIALSPDDIRAQFEKGLISLPLGMENGSPLTPDLSRVEYFYDRGIRYITLSHGKSNALSDSSYDENRQWDGLSDFGAEVVREMNRLGIIVDISHVDDAAFYDVLDISAVPVIASHSSARHFTPGWERNMSDDMIRALAASGGVIMINFGSSFITDQARQYSSARAAAGLKYKSENPEVDDRFLWDEFPRIYAAEHGPFPYASLDDVLDHFDHVVAIAGIEHVGIGSDYDGVGDSLPTGLKDVSTYPTLVAGLLGRGYSENDIRMLLGENLLRVWSAVEDYAAGGS